MATKTWVSTDGNWDTAGSWSPSGVPATSDDVYFVSGSKDVTSGFAQSGVTLASLNFAPKYSGSINTALEINATTVDYANRVGTVTLEGTYTTMSVQVTATDNPSLTINDSTITTLRMTGGNGTVYVNSGSTISGVIEIIGAKGVRLEIQSGATVNGVDVTIDSGKILSYEEFDTVTMFGGNVEMQNATGTTASITMYRGNCKYKVTGATTLTTLLMYGGFFDMRGATAPSHTITNTTMYEGSIINERNGLANTIYTNPLTINGGVIKCDLGREVTVT